MSEDQRKVYESSPGSAVMFHDAGPIPGNEPCFWLQSLDITPHDFPYIQPHIRQLSGVAKRKRRHTGDEEIQLGPSFS